MTKYITIALLAGALFACGEADTNAKDVPAAVMTAFNAAYPGATDVEWEKEGDGYEVEFDMNGEEMEVEFDMNGMIVDKDD